MLRARATSRRARMREPCHESVCACCAGHGSEAFLLFYCGKKALSIERARRTNRFDQKANACYSQKGIHPSLSSRRQISLPSIRQRGRATMRALLSISFCRGRGGGIDPSHSGYIRPLRRWSVYSTFLLWPTLCLCQPARDTERADQHQGKKEGGETEGNALKLHFTTPLRL